MNQKAFRRANLTNFYGFSLFVEDFFQSSRRDFVNFLFWFDEKGQMEIADMNMKLRGETRQNAENKQTFGLTGKIEINEKTRQNSENKQTFDLTGKIKK